MKFFERDLCEKLVELGCVSGEMFWHDSQAKHVLYFYSDRDHFIKRNCTPAFTPYDFIAPTEQARRNKYIIGVSLLDMTTADSESKIEQMIRKAVGL